jgi:hypothetical protein
MSICLTHKNKNLKLNQRRSFLPKMTYNETVRAAEKNKKGIDFKFNEDRILADLQQYVEATYDSHYAQTKSYQATEIIIDQGHGTGFCMGNIMKYAQRYGKKEGHNKADLMKVIHYAMIQLSTDHYK